MPSRQEHVGKNRPAFCALMRPASISEAGSFRKLQRPRSAPALRVKHEIHFGRFSEICGEAAATYAHRAKCLNMLLHRRDWIPTEEDGWGVLCAARAVIAHVLGPV
jgi:hypothetical protein